ncbi:MAG: IreB family regulatory phosphoprotein [Clostridia bacterium]|nr:IreB family regulatory phosphoprotein [Clostridia bacterium]
MNNNRSDTQKFSVPKDAKTAQDILMTVYSAMREKGYDPVNQIVGYLLSGDPTYITSYNNARYLILRMERDDLLDELVRFYVKNHKS